MLDDEVLALAREVIIANRDAGRKIAVAESCTGGLVSAALTAVPGSSEVFDRGYVTYSNEAKQDMLGVSGDILDSLGAVSEGTAWAMAQGALARSGAQVAVAVSGVAGPAGGSEKKPVGMVVFARALAGEDEARSSASTKNFGDLGRDEIRRQATLVALRLLLP
jgi:nicotinamide-nucleotide amidase